MQTPSVADLVAIYDQPKFTSISHAEWPLFQKYGVEPLIPSLLQTFPLVNRAPGRASLLFWLTKYSRKYPQITELAMTALNDRAYLVREHACSILAYSLRSDSIAALALLQSHKDERTRADATAAMDAISSKNHHFYADRQHTGQSFWILNPEDDPSAP